MGGTRIIVAGKRAEDKNARENRDRSRGVRPAWGDGMKISKLWGETYV